MPNERLPEIGSTITIEKPAFNTLLLRLKEEGYLPIGPRVKNESLVYEQIESLEDLPQGYSTSQKPGHFQLYRGKYSRYFDIIPGAHSWKQFLFPSRVELFTLHKNGKNWDDITSQLDAPKYAFIGPNMHSLAYARANSMPYRSRITFSCGPTLQTRSIVRAARVSSS